MKDPKFVKYARTYQKHRETWGVNDSVKLAAKELGTTERDVRDVLGLDEEGHYRGSLI